MESHLLQMRGLKPFTILAAKEAPKVASFTDAWIETSIASPSRKTIASRSFYRCVD